jgi:hypothetical protein
MLFWGCVKVEQSARVAGHGHPSPFAIREGGCAENGSLVSMERSTSIVAAGLLSGALGCHSAGQGRQPTGPPENTGAPNLGGSHTARR